MATSPLGTDSDVRRQQRNEEWDSFSRIMRSSMCDVSSTSFRGGDTLTNFFADLISGKLQDGVINVKIHKPATRDGVSLKSGVVRNVADYIPSDLKATDRVEMDTGIGLGGFLGLVVATVVGAISLAVYVTRPTPSSFCEESGCKSCGPCGSK